MSKIVKYIEGRLRGFFGNRRQNPRHLVQPDSGYPARLLLSISLPQSQPASSSSSSHPSRLIGSTRNLSESGLAIIVSSARLDSGYITEENCSILIELEIYPSGTIEMEAEVVHYQPLEEEKFRGYLMGVRITKMSEGDRDLYLGYLDILKYRDYKKDADEIVVRRSD